MRKLALLCLLSLFPGDNRSPRRHLQPGPRSRPRSPAPPHRRRPRRTPCRQLRLPPNTLTANDGSFTIPSIPLGDYILTISQSGFATQKQSLTLASDTSPILHIELQLNTVEQTTTVTTDITTANVDTVTPTTLISRKDIAETPGADRTNSMAMITDYVPGAYMTHDMLHMRGGHQVSWLIDGVQIPNTNIASNLAAQIDPKDIDYIEVQRGSYTSDVGDRTYGVFNVVPRTGFERNRQAELILTAGNFFQTDDQLNFGDHTEKFAYYASLNGNRSDYGLSPPVPEVLHDATNGYGGFASFIYNRTPKDQFRLITQLRNDYFQIPYDPDPDSPGNQQFDSSGLRDSQRETDGVVAFSWLHTYNPSTVLQVSPFYHYNRADYQPNPNDTPVATTSDRTSNYAGAQASITASIARNTLQAGLYSFGQHDSYLFGAVFNDNSGNTNFSIPDQASGGIVEEYINDNFKATPWLTFILGVRQSHFQSQITENVTSPRFGAAIQIPKLHWVFRGFYGRFYQPPPLLTATGPIVQFAQANNTDFVPSSASATKSISSAYKFPSTAGSSTPTPSRPASTTSSTTPTSATPAFTIPSPSMALSSAPGNSACAVRASGISAKPTSPTPTRSPSSAEPSPAASSALPSPHPSAMQASTTNP